MSSSAHATYLHSGGYFLPLWLPPNAHTNGLTATAWTPLLDLPAASADDVRELLRRSGVPAATAALHARLGRRSKSMVRLWVASQHVATAEDVLMSKGPFLR